MTFLNEVLTAHKLIDPAVARLDRLTPVISEVNAHLGHGIEPLGSVDSYLETYAAVTWVYSAVYAIQANISKLPIKIYDRPADEEDRKDITDNPKFDLFKKPDPFKSRFMFWMHVMGSLELSGELFVYTPKANENAPPVGAIPLNPSRVKIVPDPQEYIKGYIYTIQGRDIPFEPWEMFHVAYYNPNDDYRGLSPLQAARNDIILELHSVNWAKDFFKQGTRSSGLLKIDGKVGAEQYQRIKDDFNDKYTGSQKTMILEQGMDFVQTSLDPKDADFINQRTMSKRAVLAVYGVPPLMVMDLTDSSILQNTEIQRKLFWEETLMPKMTMFMDEFNTELLPAFGVEGAVAEFDTSKVEALQENRVEKEKRYFEGFARGAVTPNEIRQDVFEKEPIADTFMDTTYIPMNILPGGTDTSIPEKAFALAERKAKKTKRVRDQQWKAFIGRVVPIERKFVPVLVKLFRELEEEVLRNWNSQKDFTELVRKYNQKPEFGFDALFDEQEWIKRFQEAGLPFLADAVKTGGAAVLADLVTDQVFDMTNPFVVDFIEQRLKFFGTQVIGTTQKDMVKAIAEGMKNNETIELIADRLKRQFDLAEQLRAPRIARTEVSTGFNSGNLEGMRQSGRVNQKQWLTSRDADVRETHSIDGQTKMLDEDFDLPHGYTGYSRAYPSDYNERCTLIPVKLDMQ